MISVDDLAESGKCPCEVCSSQDNEEELLNKQSKQKMVDKERA